MVLFFTYENFFPRCVTVQNRIFFTYLYLDNTTGMTHLKILNTLVQCQYYSVRVGITGGQSGTGSHTLFSE